MAPQASGSAPAPAPPLDPREADALRTYFAVAQHLDDPIRVGDVRMEGAARTRPSLVRRVLLPLLGAATLGDLVTRLRRAARAFERLELFDHVDVAIDSRELSSLWAGEERPVDVLFAVREAPIARATGGLVLGDSEAGARASVVFPSLFGGAERLEGRAYAGSRTSSEILARLSVPFRSDPDETFGATAFRRVKSFAPASRCEEAAHGATVDYKFVSRLGLHELAYHAHWRNLYPSDGFWPRFPGWSAGGAVSEAIRDQAGHDFKSAFSHTFVRDTRDDPLFPSQGSFLKLSQEYADVGGDVKFVKGQAETQVSVSPAARLAITGGVRGGLLVPLGGQRSRINDRFFLGGATNIRGFKFCGIGPREGDDALGGELFVAANFSATARLNDSRGPLPLYAHAWVNGGKLVYLDKTATAAENARNLADAPAAAAGVGLACKFGNIRGEANISVPLSSSARDLPSSGFQFGFGFEFM